ncbi:MAG: Hsp20 family protein [Nitratireductor sp.]|nr:Hsp20 family protein [Nitratireductor sp.]MCB1456663.1 Hsp20 family protein [Nitratireductor sp.]MCB1458951.1 Hsp20 family protein [Nitratireductor sp.]
MTRIAGFSSPLLLGFDELERMLDRVSKSTSDGYPPYNIERIKASGSKPETLCITLAVAGFAEDDLDISIEHNQLTVRGRQAEDAEREFLHRGIAARQFQRSFVLAEGIEVSGATLSNGLLAINLVRLQPERVVRRISISSKE